MATTLGSQVIGDVGNLLASPALHLGAMVAWVDQVDLVSACCDLGPVNGSGALAHKVGIWSPTNLEAAALSEGTAVTFGDPADTTFTITVAKQKAAFGRSDELMIVAPPGYDVELLVGQLAQRMAMQCADLIAATFPSFTAGPAAGSPMSVGLLLESYFDFLALRCPSGEGIAVIGTTPYEQLVQSFRAEGSGDLLLRDSTTPAGLSVHLMQGYKGQPIRGLHLVETGRVTTASSNYEQAILGVPMPGPNGGQVSGSIFYKWGDQSPLIQYAVAGGRMETLGSQIQRLAAQAAAQGLMLPGVPPPPVLVMITWRRVDDTGETAFYAQSMIGFACDAAKGVRLRSAA